MSDPRWTAETEQLVFARLADQFPNSTINDHVYGAQHLLSALAEAGLLVEPGSETRTWSLPAEPGPEVTAVRDRNSRRWERDKAGRWYPTRGGRGRPGTERPLSWSPLVFYYGPLTDATAEAINGAQT